MKCIITKLRTQINMLNRQKIGAQKVNSGGHSAEG